MKYYNHKGEEVSKSMYEFLKEKDYLLYDNCFEERTKDSKKLVYMSDVIFDGENRIVGFEKYYPENDITMIFNQNKK